MQTDALTNFIGVNATPVSAVGAAGTEVPLGNVIDLLGNGVGQAPTSIIGDASVFGVDPGVDSWKPEILVQIGAAFTTGDAATGTFRLEYAADSGSGGGYQPGTWYVAAETGPHAVAVLGAGARIRMDLAPAPPEVPTPRFVRMALYPGAGLAFTGGTMTFAGLTMARDDVVNMQAASNYTVA